MFRSSPGVVRQVWLLVIIFAFSFSFAFLLAQEAISVFFPIVFTTVLVLLFLTFLASLGAFPLCYDLISGHLDQSGFLHTVPSTVSPGFYE